MQINRISRMKVTREWRIHNIEIEMNVSLLFTAANTV